jgi:hypothetical protein
MLNFVLQISNPFRVDNSFKDVWTGYKKLSDNWSTELQIYRNWATWFHFYVEIRGNNQMHRGINIMLGCVYVVNFDLYDGRHDYD